MRRKRREIKGSSARRVESFLDSLIRHPMPCFLTAVVASSEIKDLKCAPHPTQRDFRISLNHFSPKISHGFFIIVLLANRLRSRAACPLCPLQLVNNLRSREIQIFPSRKLAEIPKSRIFFFLVLIFIC